MTNVSLSNLGSLNSTSRPARNAAATTVEEAAVADAPSDVFVTASGSKSGNAAAVTKAASVANTSPADGAEAIPGLFKLLRKDDKVWFSIRPEQFDQPFFFSANVSKSVGEKGLVGSEMGSAQLATFHRAGNQIQLVAKNTQNFATPGSPEAKFVSEDYADGLIASAPVIKGKDGEILVEANALLFTDIPDYAGRLQDAYKTRFPLDVKNTSFAQVDNTDTQTSFGVQAHYTAPDAITGALPGTTPVGRSVLAEFRYNFSELPAVPMTPRLADDRIGHFVTTRKDYDGDTTDGKVRYVNRWRLEKQDPSAPVSAPVKPITYWVANDVPERYRESVKEGILEWNKAFERIGFHNAIEVKQQTSADAFDTMDAHHASVRWYTAADVGSAVGPSQVDPRSGEILDADIRMADVFARSAHTLIADNPPGETHSHGDDACEYLHHAGVEQQFASSLLDMRGEGALGDELAKAYVKDVVMHEVGHTLGLRHNFKGSTIHTTEQLQDAELTKTEGLGSSVMDYHPFNVALAGEKQGEYVQSTLGAYDYLAIQYAYAPLDPAAEKDALKNIAVQTTTNPVLAYESDEAADASDPEVSRFDLGSDPLEFANRQVKLAHELWNRAESKVLPEGADYSQLTRAFSGGLNKISGAGRYMARFIGGVNVRRDHAGTGRAVQEPVAADKQRDAMNSIVSTFFQPDSFKFKPEFTSHLAKNRFESWGDQNIHVGQSVLRTQVGMLNSLYAKDVAQRLIEAPEKLAEGTPTFSLGEMYDTVQNSIWSELDSKTEISQGRRDLQREHLKAVLPLLNPAAAPREASSLMRFELEALKAKIDDQAKTPGLSLENRAHLSQCSQTLRKALED